MTEPLSQTYLWRITDDDPSRLYVPIWIHWGGSNVQHHLEQYQIFSQYPPGPIVKPVTR
jgi:hypothetical protein